MLSDVTNMRFDSLILSYLLLLVSGCSFEPHAIKHAAESSPVRDRSVYVANHGWHTGLIISSESVNVSLPFLIKRFGSVPYYEFGWGDEGFYQAKEITSFLKISAIFWPTDAVMHVVAVSLQPDKYFSGSEVIELKLSHSELESLQVFISNSFKYTDAGRAIKLEKGIYGDSQFYRATGKYHMFNTCNKWTANGLKSAGMDIVAGFKLTADSVMSYVKQYKVQVRLNSDNEFYSE